MDSGRDHRGTGCRGCCHSGKDTLQGKPLSAVGRYGGDGMVTAEARRLFAASNVAPRIALLGESPVDRVMATFFLGRVRSPCPARFFTSSEEAMHWLTALSRLHPDWEQWLPAMTGQGNDGAVGV